MGHRSYDQYCPVAVALDTVGDRWTLLIVRELLMGDRRFTDLRTALPGLAPNLLAERLRDLQADGLVEHVDLPPPVARQVYRATPAGRSLVPVLQALARFGAERLGPPGDRTLRPAMVVFGLLTPFHHPEEGRFHVRLVVDGEPFDLLLDGPRLSARERADEVADAVVTVAAVDLAAARHGERPLVATAEPAAALERFARQFGLPLTPVGASSAT